MTTHIWGKKRTRPWTGTRDGGTQTLCASDLTTVDAWEAGPPVTLVAAKSIQLKPVVLDKVFPFLCWHLFCSTAAGSYHAPETKRELHMATYQFLGISSRRSPVLSWQLRLCSCCSQLFAEGSSSATVLLIALFTTVSAMWVSFWGTYP